MKKDKRKLIVAAGFTACCYAVLNYIGKRIRSGKQAVGDRYCNNRDIKEPAYEKSIKPMLDKVLSFAGLLLLAPLYVCISTAVFVDDPGPVFFKQERIGKGKKHFCLHKFRSMKMSTPHDVPTHQLSNPEQYITRVGKFLRKYSLDELPQIWDIFIGNMSIIGPRPALWNQDDLVAERDKYRANDVKPGLTGWAQINGRDELEIAEKAKLDGEYVRHLQQGGMRALLFDMRCFLGTVFSVLGSRGVVEGGTGEMNRKGEKLQSGEAVDAADAGFADYGHRKHFAIDTTGKNKKRVLITGAGSYIGESFEKWAREHYSANFVIDTLDMQSSSWREKDFSPYDTVFHVAGIAHADAGRASEEEKKKYYEVNTNLAIETAEKAKAEGVKQFVFMSSMIIYGDSAPYGKEKVIDETTVPVPANFYGDSKWQADKGVRKLADKSFRVAVLRPPMVYGKGSRGNYQALVKLAKILPVFPDVENRRSMLYIDNLCEFLCKLMLSGEGGIYFPQNEEYVKTSEMVKKIAEYTGNKIWITKFLNPAVGLGSYMPGKIASLTDKAFGNFVYSKNLSRYMGLEYLEKEKEVSDPLVTIITAAYNSEKTLAKTIESVLSQTYSRIEYIIIDGLSSDRTVKIAESYKNDFLKKGFLYRIISEKDDGMYDAINKGIAIAHGKIIGNINSDDWYEADAVEKTIRFFQKTNCDFMYADLRMVKKDGKSYIKHSREGKIVTSRNWNHPTQFVKSCVYEQEKYKCESLHDDFDLLLRVKAKNYKIGIMNEVTANFRLDGMSHEKNLQKAIQRIKARYRIYRNNNYCRLYWLECFLVEAAKFVFG